MSYNADVSLEFQDGTLPGNSTHLGMYSSVLRGACEAGTAASSKQQDSLTIPMPGLTKSDWMTVTPFLYPVIPRATISSWPQLEVLLKVSSQLDIALVLHEADCYLATHVKSLAANQESPQNIWKWLQLADKAGLQQCIPRLAIQAAEVDRAGCAQLSKLQELSLQVLQQLTVVCASSPGQPVEGSKCQKRCSTCSPFAFAAPGQPLPPGVPPPQPSQPSSAFIGGFGVPVPQLASFTLSWVCDKCHTIQS